jgi:hypothetical protein
VQEGGDVTFTATENPPVVMPATANRTGATHAHVTWLKPLEGMARLLTTLLTRDNVETRCDSESHVAKQRLQSLNTAHVFGSSILFEVKTTNRRAGCGKSACPVRRGEGPNPIGPSYPYRWG